MQPLKITFCLVTFIIFFTNESLYAALIDNFDDWASITGSPSVPNGNTTIGTSPNLVEIEFSAAGSQQITVTDSASNMIGGTRVVDFNVTNSAFGDPGSFRGTEGLSGFFRISADSGVVYSSTITWGSLSSVDLTDSGASNAFALDLLSSNAGTSVTITVEDADSDVSSFSTTTPSVLFGSPETLLIDFSDFSSDINFAAIDSIVLTVEGNAQDIAVDFFETRNIPEPTSMAIFGLGFLGLAGTACRRRRNAAVEK